MVSTKGIGNRALPLAFISLFVILLSVFVFPPSAFGSSVFYLSLIFIGASIIFSQLVSGRSGAWKYIGLEFDSRLPKLALYGVALGILSIGATLALSMALYFFGWLDTEPVLEKIGMLSPAALFAAFTIAPLGEEMLFRGFIFKFVSEWISKRWAGRKDLAWVASAVLSSALFSICHAPYGSYSELAVAFLVGLLFCAAAKRFNSIVPAIVAHGLFNLASVVSVVLF
jgi:membrane protease YdiL (CAAX protease family)